MIDTTKNLLFNINLQQYICQMINLNLSNLNYFQTNTTCQLLNNNINNTIFIQYYPNSTFIFLNRSSISITDNYFTAKFIKYDICSSFILLLILFII